MYVTAEGEVAYEILCWFRNETVPRVRLAWRESPATVRHFWLLPLFWVVAEALIGNCRRFGTTYRVPSSGVK